MRGLKPYIKAKKKFDGQFSLYQTYCFYMVAGEGIEPPTSRLWAWQATSALPRDKYCYLE